MSSMDASPDLIHPSDPTQDRPADAALPPRLGRVLLVVRVLITYGKNLAEAFERRAGRPILHTAMLPFGTEDRAAILARIACGLRRALALEARLLGYASTGRDLPPPRPTDPAQPRRDAAPRQRAASLSRTEHARRADPEGLPTVEQIAADALRRPIGVVVADICRDLGLLPGQCDREVWQELSHVITTYGGRLSRWVTTIDRRIRHSLRNKWRMEDAGEPAASAPYAPPARAAATGPPRPPDDGTVLA